MIPSARTLSKPKFAILYNILLSLMVILFSLNSALSNDQVVYLRHDKTTGRLTMSPGSKSVMTSTDTHRLERYQRLIVSASSNFDLTFYNPASKRFLCFKPGQKHWKLFGLRRPKHCEMCRFKEKLENGFHTYYIEQENGKQHFLAFKKNGQFADNSTINAKFMKLSAKSVENETTKRPRRHHAGDPHRCVDKGPVRGGGAQRSHPRRNRHYPIPH